MTIEQAKECLNSIDLFAYGDEKNEYEFEEVKQALDKAIASLECINEIIELIKNSSDKQYRNNNHWIYIGDKKGLADVLDIINKHLKEIEK